MLNEVQFKPPRRVRDMKHSSMSLTVFAIASQLVFSLAFPAATAFARGPIASPVPGERFCTSEIENPKIRLVLEPDRQLDEAEHSDIRRVIDFRASVLDGNCRVDWISKEHLVVEFAPVSDPLSIDIDSLTVKVIATL